MSVVEQGDAPLKWELLVKKRGSATQGVPPGKEALAWVTNAAARSVRDTSLPHAPCRWLRCGRAAVFLSWISRKYVHILLFQVITYCDPFTPC